jgi:hypothetical protein
MVKETMRCSVPFLGDDAAFIYWPGEPLMLGDEAMSTLLVIRFEVDAGGMKKRL